MAPRRRKSAQKNASLSVYLNCLPVPATNVNHSLSVCPLTLCLTASVSLPCVPIHLSIFSSVSLSLTLSRSIYLIIFFLSLYQFAYTPSQTYKAFHPTFSEVTPTPSHLKRIFTSVSFAKASANRMSSSIPHPRLCRIFLLSLSLSLSCSLSSTERAVNARAAKQCCSSRHAPKHFANPHVDRRQDCFNNSRQQF